MPSDLENVRSKLVSDTGLAEVITTRGNGRPLVSVVNAGIIAHPASGDEVIAFVSRGNAARLGHLRSRPEITVAVRRGWDWTGVDGTAELAGPNDPHPAVPASALPQLLRDIFRAAGGHHDDYDEYDRAMAEDQRTAVLITPERTYGNHPSL
jgi:PPOX class probable F420-dependent enzyme